MLEQGLGLLGLKREDVKRFIKLNSYVDKCDIIMHEKRETLDQNKVDGVKDKYIELMAEARRVCYMRIN